MKHAIIYSLINCSLAILFIVAIINGFGGAIISTKLILTVVISFAASYFSWRKLVVPKRYSTALIAGAVSGIGGTLLIFISFIFEGVIRHRDRFMVDDNFLPNTAIFNFLWGNLTSFFGTAVIFSFAVSLVTMTTGILFAITVDTFSKNNNQGAERN
jgi:hypothetical protein